MPTRHLLLGRLRRDTMILGSSEDTGELKAQGEAAVKEGRAAEVFIIATQGYYTESDQNWGGIDRYQGGTFDTAPSSVPPLNPGAGPQEPDGLSDRETVSIAGNIEQAAQDQRDSGVIIDTGASDELARMARGGADGAVAAGGNEAKAKESQEAEKPSDAAKRTTSFDEALAAAKKPEPKK